MSPDNKDLNLSVSKELNSIQITINFNSPAVDSLPEQSSRPGNSIGVLMRQAIDGRVYLTFMPPGADKQVQREEIPSDPNEQMDWRYLLTGDPSAPLEIDEGVVVMDLNDDGSGIAAWLPNDTTLPPVTRRLSAPASGGPGTGWGEFVSCVAPKGWSISGIQSCLYHLRS